MAFSFSNWFKTKPGSAPDETDPNQSNAATTVAPGAAEPDAGQPAVEAPAPAAPAASLPPPKPASSLKSAVPNTVKPVTLHEGSARPDPAAIPLPSLTSVPRQQNAPAQSSARTIAFPSGSPASGGGLTMLPQPAAQPKLGQPTPVTPPQPAAPALPEVPIQLELGDFLDNIPSQLLKQGQIARNRPVIFKSSDLSSELARGKAAVSVSAIYALCPDIFQRPIPESDNIEVPLPLPKIVAQLASNLKPREDQVAEENVGQIETPFLQVALEDNARIPKAAAPVSAPAPAAPVRVTPAPAPVAVAPVIPSVPKPAAAPVVVQNFAPAPSTPTPAVPRDVAPISMPHQPAPVSQHPAHSSAQGSTSPRPQGTRTPLRMTNVVRPTHISAVRPTAPNDAPSSPSPLTPPLGPAPIGSHKRPPSTVRASVAGGKIRLSGPVVSARGVNFGESAQTPPPVPANPPAGSYPIVVKPVAPLAAPTSASGSNPNNPGTILKRTARIQIPAISLRGNEPPAIPPLPASQPHSALPMRTRPMPVTEAIPKFHALPGGALPPPLTRPVPVVPPPSALRPIPLPSPAPITERASFPAPPPLPFAPPTQFMPLSQPPAPPVEAPPETPAPPVVVPEAITHLMELPAEPVTAIAPLPETAPIPQSHPVIVPTPVPNAADPNTGVLGSENTIQLALAPILRALPNSYLSLADTGSLGVDDTARVSLPLDLITSQLAHGRVSVSRQVFEAGLPPQHRDILAPGTEPTEIPLPLQEIFQNLPMGALTQRDDQVVDEVRPLIPTPFSQKAEEDAQALRAASALPILPEPELASEPAEEPVHQEPSPVDTSAQAQGEEVSHEQEAITPSIDAIAETSHAPTSEVIPHIVETEETAQPPSVPDAISEVPPLVSTEAPVEAVEHSPEPLLVDHESASLATAQTEPEQEEPKPDPIESAHPGQEQPETSLAQQQTVETPAELEPQKPSHSDQVHHQAVSTTTEPEVAAVPQSSTDHLTERREQAQEALREVFMVEEDLDAKKIVTLVCQLPGVSACTIMFTDGLKLAGNFTPDQASAGFCAMTPALFQKARTYSQELNLGDLQHVSIHTERGLLLSFFLHETICLSVAHTGRGFMPGVREKLQVVTRQLATLYAI